MHKTGHSIIHRGRRPRPRTWVILPNGGASSGAPADNQEAPSRLPAWVRSAGRQLRDPRVALALGLAFIAILSVAIHIYSSLSAEIDLRLQRNFFDNSSGIYMSPFKLSEGDRMPADELVQYLRAAGYRESKEAGLTPDSYAREGDSIRIWPDAETASHLNLAPIEVVIRNDHVWSITHLDTGERLPNARVAGELLATVRHGERRKKEPVTFSEIPAPLRDAVLAVEDRRFFSHGGIDWRGIGRALWIDLNEGRIAQGGSTLTQQLIKNSFLSADRTFRRKLKEAAMAVILESRLSKKEIFTLYCNEVYLGHSGTFAIHGLAEAARHYFDKRLADLTLAESAFLAGLIQAPGRYAPHRDPQRAVERRNVVLKSMVETGAITDAQAEAASREPLNVVSHRVEDDFGITYFMDYAQRYFENTYGGGVRPQERVYTTLDPRLQRAAFEAVSRHTERLDRVLSRGRRKGEPAERVQAALVALDAHTGDVLAMIGGRDYDESQLNRATDARRQPGSTFKPFVYAAAIRSRAFTPASVLMDAPQTFTYDGGRAEYKPENFRGGFSNRRVTLREALTRSLNVPTVELALRVGLSDIARLAEEAGMSPPRVYPSMALGASEVTPLELAAAYTAFANDGMAVRPIPARSVVRAGSSKRSEAVVRRVFSPQVAYLMTDMLRSVVEQGTASRVRSLGLKGALAGKTGTANDGWFVGYTPNLVCVTWVGFDDNRDMRMQAADTALPIWGDFMKEALAMRPDLGGADFAKPGGLSTVEIDPRTGMLATSACPERRKEIFLAGTEPLTPCNHEAMIEAMLDAIGDAPLFGEEGELGEGTVTLEICGETGLLAASTCAYTRRVRFVIGMQPLESCSPERHARLRRGDEDGERIPQGVPHIRSGVKEAPPKSPPPPPPRRPDEDH